MQEPNEPPSMYGEFANWFHLLTSSEEYADEAGYYSSLLESSAHIPVRTVLELGSGGGNNASHMKQRFELTLADLSDEMLELSRSINPECEHLQGDMRNLRLGREFDGVFVHDAIVYMTTEGDLGAAIETAFVHCKRGGAAVFGPDVVKEELRATTDHGGHDGEGRSMRYLEWVWDPDPDDDTYIADYAYLLRESDGTVRVAYDRHVCGAFSRATWLRLIEEAGFIASRHKGLADATGLDTFVGVKP